MSYTYAILLWSLWILLVEDPESLGDSNLRAEILVFLLTIKSLSKPS